MTSFVTAIKLMPNYEDYARRLEMYIECVSEGMRGSPYEIIVVEDQSDKNVAWIRDAFTSTWLEERNARLVEYAADYPNPHGYNMIEAYAKNVGLNLAKYPYVCLTNCDVLFNADFFDLCRHRLKPRTFYRFLEYETPPVVSWNLKKIQETLTVSTCINEGLLTQRNLKSVAFKSGDAMLMDAESWRMIRGFPENEVWVHSDLIVCNVVNNNGLALVVDEQAKVYTYPQERTVVEREFELAKTYEYFYRRTCN
jgi:hypothetical protein